MSRLALLTESDMTPEQREQFDRFPSNLTRALLLMDGRLAAALPNLANALRASSLDAKLREAVILRVAAMHNSAYERMQHLGQARKTGWSDVEIAEIEGGSETVKDIALTGVLRFVEACVKGPKVSDGVFATIREHLSDCDIATVIVLVGHYSMVARFVGVLEIPLDAQPDSWEHEH